MGNYNSFLSERLKIVSGLAPDADALAGTKTTDVVNMGLYERIMFVVHRGAGTTGTQVLTVQASAANNGASPTAIPFKYRRIDVGSGTPADEADDFTDATASGFTTEAGGSDVYLIEVQAADLPEDKPWVHLKSVEGVDAAVDASVLIVLGNARYGGNMPSAI